MKSSPRVRTIFGAVAIGCTLFVVLTAIAMFFYPGGTVVDVNTVGYSFVDNFFSDLGRTQSRAGQPNPIAATLFLIALTSGGVALIVFFLCLTRLFQRAMLDRILSWLGTLAGILAGLGFIGVALTPANVNGPLHNQLVFAAFEAVTVAAILYLIVMLRDRSFPNHLAMVFGVFAILLVLYLGLLFFGPSTKTPEGLRIQVVGQKVIAYASIISVLIQSLGVRRLV